MKRLTPCLQAIRADLPEEEASSLKCLKQAIVAAGHQSHLHEEGHSQGHEIFEQAVCACRPPEPTCIKRRQ